MPNTLNKYVKFVRGSKVAFENLGTKRDNDTLYFIYGENDSSGELYLGNRLICGGISSAGKLSDLSDIVLNEVKANQVLIYDEGQKKWINQGLENNETLINSIVEKLSTEENLAKLAPVFKGVVPGLVPVSLHETKGKHILTDAGTWIDMPVGTLT